MKKIGLTIAAVVAVLLRWVDSMPDVIQDAKESADEFFNR